MNFQEEKWDILEKDWNAWWRNELDRPMVMIEFVNTPLKDVRITNQAGSSVNPHRLRCSIPEDIRYVTNYPLDMPAETVLAEYRARMENFYFAGDAWPRWYPNLGPGIVSGYLGGAVHSTKETVWFGPLDKDNMNHHPKMDSENKWWKRTLELTEAALHSFDPTVCLGFADLGGNLDIIASLWGTEELLFAFHDDPGSVSRWSEKITEFWIDYYKALEEIITRSVHGTTSWAHLWAEKGCYMLQSDFSYMISPAHFEEYVMPDLEKCCNVIDYPFYHLDGKGQIEHLDMLLSLKSLKGIQWIPGEGSPGPEHWLPLLHKIRRAGKLCQLYVTAEGALTIIKELGGEGFAFAITDINSPETADDFITTVSKAVK